MPRGGSRSGSGRKPNGECQKTKQRKELIAKVSAEGPTPLQVLLSVMRDHFKAKRFEAAYALKLARELLGMESLGFRVVKLDEDEAKSVAMMAKVETKVREFLRRSRLII